MPFLERALLEDIASLIHVVIGYVNVFCERGGYSSSQDILLWGINVLSGLKDADRPNFLDKISSMFFVCLAYSQSKAGDNAAAYRSLHNAREIAQRFDAAPDYEANAVRFVTHGEGASVHDDLGTTAADGVQKTIASFADETLSALWKEMTEHEK